MKQINFNDSNLSDNQIDKVSKKVRALVLNSKGQALLVHYAELYMLPGGSVDFNESDLDALKREISEEAGIELSSEQAIPFLTINSYDKDYFDRKDGIINRLTHTIIYEVHTDAPITDSKKSLTESEKSHNHSIKWSNLSVIRYLVENNPTTNPKNKQFKREMLTILSEFENWKKQTYESVKDR